MLDRVLVAVSGNKRHGKNTVGDFVYQYLEENSNLPTEFVAFADPVREALTRLDPWMCNKGVPGLLSDVIGAYGGWEGVKTTKWADEVRRLLTRAGDNMGRDFLGKDVWVDKTVSRILEMSDNKACNVIVTDLRRWNEKVAIESLYRVMSPVVIRVVRPDELDDYSHPSESDVSQLGAADYVITNDGSLEDLKVEVWEVMDDVHLRVGDNPPRHAMMEV